MGEQFLRVQDASIRSRDRECFARAADEASALVRGPQGTSGSTNPLAGSKRGFGTGVNEISWLCDDLANSGGQDCRVPNAVEPPIRANPMDIPSLAFYPVLEA